MKRGAFIYILVSLITAITVIALGLFVHTLVAATVYDPEINRGTSSVTGTLSALLSSDDSTTAPATATPASTSPVKPVQNYPSTYPNRLVIPALNINAAVQYLGINQKGNMMAPDNFTDVGWYKYGTIPGQEGTAVIDGHVDNGLALAGVFKHLSDIKVGDDIYVLNRAGVKTHFVVTQIDIYGYQDAPADLIFNQSGGMLLRLITCEGDWVAGGDTYDHRLVVTAAEATSSNS